MVGSATVGVWLLGNHLLGFGFLGMVAAALLFVTPGQAGWSQAGYDAVRTGAVQGEGPEWDDVAFNLDVASA